MKKTDNNCCCFFEGGVYFFVYFLKKSVILQTLNLQDSTVVKFICYFLNQTYAVGTQYPKYMSHWDC